MGYTLGLLSLAIGLWKWLPTVIDLQETKNKLNRNEQYFSNLIENALDIITVLDKEGVIRFGSPSFERIVGYKTEELVGKNVFDFVHPEDVEATQRAFYATFQQPGIAQHQELRVIHKNGTWRILESIGKYVPDASSGLVIVNARDITDRKKTEEHLKESENRFRGAFDSVVFGASIIDLKGRFLEVNKSLCKMLGYSEEELLSKTFSDVTHPDDIQIGLDALKKQLSGKSDFVSMEKRYIRKNREIINVIISPALIHDSKGSPQYCVGLFQDITERKRAEEALSKSEEKYRKIVEMANEGIWVMDKEQRATFVNSRMAEMLGYAPDEIIGQLGNSGHFYFAYLGHYHFGVTGN